MELVPVRVAAPVSVPTIVSEFASVTRLLALVTVIAVPEVPVAKTRFDSATEVILFMLVRAVGRERVIAPIDAETVIFPAVPVREVTPKAESALHALSPAPSVEYTKLAPGETESLTS